MAIYHFHFKPISRGKGRNVVAAAAYRRATKMFDENENYFFNYEKKENVIHSEICLPEYEGDWLRKYLDSDNHQASERLWNLVEKMEKRMDARLAREVEFALPIELSEGQNIQLAREFIQDQFVAKGMIADWSIHADEGNPHVHVLLSLRKVESGGFGKKVREWNAKGLLFKWRESWAEYANQYLSRYNIEARIDQRSYREQGIDLKPSIHVGRAVTEMIRRHLKTDRLQLSSTLKNLICKK